MGSSLRRNVLPVAGSVLLVADDVVLVADDVVLVADMANQEARPQDGTGVVQLAELAGLAESQASRVPNALETAGAVQYDPQILAYRVGRGLPSWMLAAKSTRAFCSTLNRRCGRFHPCIPKLRGTLRPPQCSDSCTVQYGGRPKH